MPFTNQESPDQNIGVGVTRMTSVSQTSLAPLPVNVRQIENKKRVVISVKLRRLPIIWRDGSQLRRLQLLLRTFNGVACCQ
jgi:hypothetical protein